MKTIVLFVFVMMFLSVSYPQITITAADAQNYFNVGNTYIDKMDTLVTSINIGSTGNFTLDLSTLTWTAGFLSVAVAPGTTPFTSHFPTANVAFRQQLATQTDTSDSYAYFNVGANLTSLGVGITATSQGFTFTTLSKFLPGDMVAQFPMTLNTAWTSDYVDSTYTTIPPLPPFGSSSHTVTTQIVDGYGTITLPGKTLEVLRIRSDTRNVSQTGYNRSIDYQYLSKSGESVTVNVADTNAANNGVVAITGIFWQASGTTGVRDEVAGATDYRLLNNYPNPFNPSTKIAYYVPTASKVSISVYNVMGQKVTDVFNGVNTQGYQEVNFNAAGYASGTYFYKMNAVSLDGTKSFTSTGKMLLMK